MKKIIIPIIQFILLIVLQEIKSKQEQLQFIAVNQLKKLFGDQNWQYRQQNIKLNRQMINESNSDPDKTYVLEENNFIIWSKEQFQRNYLRLIPSRPSSIKFAKILSLLDTQQIKIEQKNKKIQQKAEKVMSYKSILGRTYDVSSDFAQKILQITQKQLRSLVSSYQPQVSSPLQQIKNYQNRVINQVRQYLLKKGIIFDQQQNSIIQKFRLKANLQKLSQEQLQTVLKKIQQEYKDLKEIQLTKQRNNRRLLQVLQQESDLAFVQKQISNVDWSCLSGDIHRQGFCGGCYAITVADNVAAMMAIYFFGYHIYLSGQDIIHCGEKSLSFGCQGGFIEGAYLYALQHGLIDGYNYPYVVQSGWRKPKIKCQQIKKRTPRFQVKGYLEVFEDNMSCKKMMLALQYHPISVGLAAFTISFYKSGVFQCLNIEKQQMNHAVLLVGYKKGYGWKLKNSWGQSWGQEGYFWLKPGNSCRLCEFGFYPVLHENFGYQNFQNKEMFAKCPPP